MQGYIDNYNFNEMEPMRYYCPPASWSEEKRRTTVKSRIFSGEWLAAEKKDGFFGKFVKDDEGNMFLFGRNRNNQGEFINKIDWVPQLRPFFESIPNGTCILGELYLPSNPGSKNVQTILGCLLEKALERQEKLEPIYFYLFDCLAFKGENLLSQGYAKRIDILTTLDIKTNFVTVGTFYRGEDLWNTLQMILAEGGEGMVLVHEDATYEPDKRPSKTTLKVKKELQDTLDVVIIGANAPTHYYTGKDLLSWPYWENSTTKECIYGTYYREYSETGMLQPVTKSYWHGWAGSLKIGLNDGGEMRQIGSISGLTDEMLKNWKNYLGKVIEISGMELMRDEKGRFTGIRHPKMLGMREDKQAKECLMNQLK